MFRKMRQLLKAQRGFTLIELMVVIAIIAIIAAVAIPKYMNAQDKARTAKVQADLAAIGSAVSMYLILDTNPTGAYPANTKALVDSSCLMAEPKDPVGNAVYPLTNGVASFTINSKTYYSNGQAPTT